ncbi:MAG TPA: nucleotidyltransferase family protein [Phycisphaerales bacterium]|nr:nucleotidyltransferase family protein [Phycisphaerales bacterium]
MPRLDDALATLRAALPDLRRDHGVRSLAIFGSVARGDAREDSDIDILVEFEPGARVSLFTLARLQTVLEDALGRPVDVVEDHPNLRPAFRARIERELVRVA